MLSLFIVSFMVARIEEQKEDNTIVFIDQSVEDQQMIADAIPHVVEVYYLKTESGGVEEMTRLLEMHENIDEILIFAKGNIGEVKLGSDYLNLSTLGNYEDELKSWDRSLSEKADILLYACNVARTDEGKAFVDRMSVMTEADVAASVDFTGDPLQGADWDLEYVVGEIESELGIVVSDYTFRLDGTTRIWDGEGSDNLWSNPKNWSGDLVPDAYDIAVFDATSNQNVYSNSDQSVYDLIITSEYTGEVQFNGELTITNDFQMSGGQLDVRTIKVNGDTLVTGGKSIEGSDFYTKGDVTISGLNQALNTALHIGKGESEASVIDGNFEAVNVIFEETGHDYQINGLITITDNDGQYWGPQLINNGLVSINNGGMIDISMCRDYFNDYYKTYTYQFDNNGSIIENGSGRLNFTSTDFYFADSEYLPVTTRSVGDRVFLSLTDLDANLDRTQPEEVAVEVYVETTSGAALSVTLVETGDNTGLFRSQSGILLTSSELEAGEGALVYDGGENLLATYTDINFSEDTQSVKMDRDPVVWVSDGTTNDWDLGSNWSTERVPRIYDKVLFDGSSGEDIRKRSSLYISEWIVDDAYTGVVTIDDNSYNTSFMTTIYNDITIDGGEIKLLSNMNVSGDVSITGGVFSNGPYEVESVIEGDLNITEGSFYFGGSTLEVNGDFSQSGGEFYADNNEDIGWSDSRLDFYGDILITGGSDYVDKLNIKGSDKKISIENVTGEVIDCFSVHENTAVNGMLEVGSFELMDDKHLEISGYMQCNDAFENAGTIDVVDEATLNLVSINSYLNEIIDDHETGVVMFPSGGIGFVDEQGVPMGEASVGDVLFVEMIDISRNLNAGIIESVEVTVSNQVTGDMVTVTLFETGIDTSVFRAKDGVALIANGAVPSAGEMKYADGEVLIAEYIDERDSSDVDSCQIPRSPIVWDGGGEDSDFSNALNWSTDTVPTRYDAIILNDTSNKEITFASNVEMYQLTIEDSYSGTITGDVNAGFYVSSDMIIKGGESEILGRLQVGRDLLLSGGKLYIQKQDTDNHHQIDGNLEQTGGVLTFKSGCYDIAGKMEILGGSFSAEYTPGYQTEIRAYDDVSLQIETNIYNLWMYGRNFALSPDQVNTFDSLNISTAGQCIVTGTAQFNDFNNGYASQTLVTGESTRMTLDGGSFNNNNALEVADSALFDASNFTYDVYGSRFYNRGIITETDDGRFKSDIKDIYFTDLSGNKIIEASVGERIYAVLVDGNLNMNGNTIEEVMVTIESLTTQDTEVLLLTETDDSSGVFKSISGVLLVDQSMEPVEGDLKYDGIEELEIDYVDATDPEDHYVGHLHRSPLVWDGGGSDNRWYTAENWSEDRVPDEYDSIVFDGTSDKNAINYRVSNLNNIEVKNSYDGVVKIYTTMTIKSDTVVSGGQLDLQSGGIISKGNFELNGGSVVGIKWWTEEFEGNITINGGSLEASGLTVGGDFTITGGSLLNEGYNLSAEGDLLLIDSETFECGQLEPRGEKLSITGDSFNIQTLNIYSGEEVEMTGNLYLTEYSKVSIYENASLTLNGSLVFSEESTQGFNNAGMITIADGGLLDAGRAKSFVNTGNITVAENVKIYYYAEAMGVTDNRGAPALDAFDFGDEIIVSLIDPNRNMDNSAVESASVLLKNWTNGDEETYSLLETEADSGEFRGSGYVTNDSDGGENQNNIFEGKNEDAFQILYTDPMSGRVEYVVSKNCAELNVEGIDELLIEGIDYGSGGIGEEAGSFSLSLQNRGDIPLGITSVSIDNTEDFTLSDDLDLSDIPPDAMRNIDIYFTPSSLGEKTANVTIKTSDNDEGELVIGLKGVGVEAPTSTDIDTILLLRGEETYQVPLFDSFEDGQDKDSELVFTIETNSNTSILPKTSINGETGVLTLFFDTNYAGDVYLTVRATDTSNAYVEESFEVIVSDKNTIIGAVDDPDGLPLEGASITIMDYFNHDEYFTTLSESDGSFSIEFPTSIIDSWRIIMVNKAPYLEFERTSYSNSDEDIGTITLDNETAQAKADRLVNDLTEAALGIQLGEDINSIKSNLMLIDTAGEGSRVEWRTSDAGVITINGAVTRNENGWGDSYVMMTATVYVDESYAEKSFNIWVMEMGNEGEPVNSAPVLDEAITDDAEISLSWNAVEGATGYKVYYSLTSGEYDVEEILLNASETSYEIRGVTNGTRYYIVIKAVHLTGDSACSNEVSAIAGKKLGIPSGVKAVAGNESIVVSFTPLSDAPDSYIVTSIPGGMTAIGDCSPITVTGLEEDVFYTFTVAAVYDQIYGESSIVSNSVSLQTDSKSSDKTTDNKYQILYNGKVKSAAEETISVVGGRKMTEIVIDDNWIIDALGKGSIEDVVTIPINKSSDIGIGVLAAQTIKEMALKSATLEIVTSNVRYKIPASAIDIEKVSKAFGEVVALKEIEVSVEVSKVTNEVFETIKTDAEKQAYKIIAEPVGFEINCTYGGKRVETSKFNQYVERRILLPDALNLGEITTAVMVNEDGRFTHVPTVITEIDGKYYAEINSLSNSLYVLIYSPMQFEDASGHWAEKAINDMGSRLVVSGNGNGEYEPNREMTRAEFAAIVVNALGLMHLDSEESVFDDVPVDAWYSDAVSVAGQYGIVSGDEQGHFKPMEKISREAVMAIVARAMTLTGLEGEQAIQSDELRERFDDFDLASDWTQEAIGRCVQMGIISGRSANLLAPQDNITRAEVASIVRRLLRQSELIN
jgi:hypothetical protein